MTPKPDDTTRGTLIARRDVLRAQMRACEEEIRALTAALRKLDRTDIYEEITTYLRMHPGRSFSQIYEALGGDRASLRTAISLLKRKGVITGWKAVSVRPYLYSVALEPEEWQGTNPLPRPHPDKD